ncbi:hypothetical protein DPEC_G00052210 [Dallia pectoralis]|uniref:Uncharacterized protein n=1 Tax=Dallia pectoralis TaxID=75939 RepID=A0ACC2HBQ9_DALPE|nr:hypothetical protein DPEC_G00052210 [Dallia pectoralis]
MSGRRAGRRTQHNGLTNNVSCTQVVSGQLQPPSRTRHGKFSHSPPLALPPRRFPGKKRGNRRLRRI